MKGKKEFDAIVFGATSFVGQIMTRYLWQRHGAQGEIKWAIAGRDKSKLEQLRISLGSGAESLPIIVANASNPDDLTDLCSKARVIASTVGPYALFGSELVKACAETGTDYCDLTGEVQWIARMIERNEAAAKASGARIVHCCGFDSIPSDMGVYFLQKVSMAQYGEPCSRVRMGVKAARGEFSGGTVASLMNVTKEVMADPSLRKRLANPFLIAPERLAARQPNVSVPEHDAGIGSWVAPFVMAAINTRVVHRSNALQDYAYGKDFKYDEVMMTGKGLKGRLMATAITAALGGFLAGAALPPTRWVLERFVVPKPGEGPSLESQNKGFYDLRFYGSTSKGNSLVVKVTGDKDPGYGSTAKILGEALVCLALDVPKSAGGFWTTSSLMGEKLVQRLQQHAGLTFDVV